MITDKTFSGEDVARIFYNNLRRDEMQYARSLICQDSAVDNLKAAAKIFKLLKYGPGAFKAVGTAGFYLFTGAARVLQLTREGKLDSLKGGFLGVLIPEVDNVPIPAELRLKRFSLPGG